VTSSTLRARSMSRSTHLFDAAGGSLRERWQISETAQKMLERPRNREIAGPTLRLYFIGERWRSSRKPLPTDRSPLDRRLRMRTAPPTQS
jgi:hypothetical protein